jgi:chromosome segregation ATPase
VAPRPGRRGPVLDVQVVPRWCRRRQRRWAPRHLHRRHPQARLRRSCALANQELETAYEELQSTNEELETTNEELQSTVEELETTNEELQSTNEELETMNEELQSTNEELRDDQRRAAQRLKAAVRACIDGRSDTEEVVLEAVNRRGRAIALPGDGGAAPSSSGREVSRRARCW